MRAKRASEWVKFGQNQLIIKTNVSIFLAKSSWLARKFWVKFGKKYEKSVEFATLIQLIFIVCSGHIGNVKKSVTVGSSIFAWCRLLCVCLLMIHFSTPRKCMWMETLLASSILRALQLYISLPTRTPSTKVRFKGKRSTSVQMRYFFLETH